MKMVEPELKMLRISQPVSLLLESLDFVDQALDGAACGAMTEVVEKTGTAHCKGLSNPLEGLDP